MTKFETPFDFTNYQYNRQEELNKTHTLFCQFLRKNDTSLHDRYLESLQLKKAPNTDFLIKIAIHLEGFLKNYFSLNICSSSEESMENISWAKKHFIQKRAKPKIKDLLNQIKKQEGLSLILSLSTCLSAPLSELTLSMAIKNWYKNPGKHTSSIQAALMFSVWAMTTKKGGEFTKGWTLFSLPQSVNYQNLISMKNKAFSYRNGFDLTDKGPSKNYALDQAFYCLYCHDRKKDSCSTGKYSQKNHILEENPLGYKLAGCPLEQKISEMNFLAAKGKFLGALAIAMIDNPLLAATGHRICQDCSKACIFQKQTPVDIPAIETFLFDTILKYPYGFEIYNLLTRWNPLNLERPLPKKPTNKKVLVVGMGPAGFTLAYHLLMEGHFVVGIDGLKIEPLSIPALAPIRNMADYFEPLSKRLPKGFGGVAEYGITARWNKNYLLPIRLILERWGNRFQLNGSTRFGSTITLDQAYEQGFDHVALCVGAGKPRLPKLPNVLANGAKLASDFLMALQLSGAQRKDTLLPLTIDLPCMVVGGGLTAVDTATEALAYYPVQIEKVLSRYEVLESSIGEKGINSFIINKLSTSERFQLQRWLIHAKELRLERRIATQEKRDPNILKFLNKWGGVHLIYRKLLQESPAYILNHPELQKALEEGVSFWEQLDIIKINTDEKNNLESITFKHKNTQESTYPARSLLWAVGIQPSTLENKKETLGLQKDITLTWPKNDKEFIIYTNDTHQTVSCFGDYHPFYAGSVVKAMASAKNGYKIISEQLKACTFKEEKKLPDFSATVYKNKQIIQGYHELIFHAPWAVKNFEPGHLYRLQPYFKDIKEKNGNLFVGEGVALTGVKVNKEKGLLHTLIWSCGLSSKTLISLMKNQPVSLMGPTGCATHFEKGEKILLVAGQLGVALGKKMRAAGCEVVYITSFRNEAYPLDKKDFLQAGDTILACSLGELPSFFKNSSHLHCIKGQTLDALSYYKSLKHPPITLNNFDRIMTIGSPKLLMNFQHKFYDLYKDLFNPLAKWIIATTTPMQCMMKGVCGQCLQRDSNDNYTFSCAWQDQDLCTLDLKFMNKRLNQNHVQELLFLSCNLHL